MVNTLDEKVLQEDERLLMQIRLFRMACNRWNLGHKECAEIFENHDVDGYINDCFEFFHVQGDEANFEEIQEYVRNRGEQL